MIKKSSSNNFYFYIISLSVILVLIPFWRLYQLNYPYEIILPTLLLFTNYRSLTKQLFLKYIQIDTRINYEPRQIPVIEAKDFSMDALRKATDNWRHPAVVRKLFLNSSAVEKWIDPNYLTSKIGGDYVIPVLEQGLVGSKQDVRSLLFTFTQSLHDIITNNQSTKYLFFPILKKNRYNDSEELHVTTQKFRDDTNQLILDDLKINEIIWNGFGTKKHSTYVGSQFLIGRGGKSTDKTTGTGWHCEGGSNFFIQVAGKKRWYFLDTEYSPYMYPLRNGEVSIMTGKKDIIKYHQHLPLRYTDLEQGDMIYNPEWEWHTIYNYEGLSIGLAAREFNSTLAFRNNFIFTNIALVNRIMKNIFGYDIGGFHDL